VSDPTGMYQGKLDADIHFNRGFTVLWLFPVTLFVGLVSIDKLSQFIPGLVSRIWLALSSCANT
jgi:hypothetical protein